MTIVHVSSLDMTVRPLSLKKKDAIKRLRTGSGYNAYVLKMDGTLLKYELSNNKQGYTLRTLKPDEFKVI